MNKIWTSRRVASNGSVTSILWLSATSELPDSGSRGPLSSPLPDSGTSALRHCRTLSVRNTRTHEL
jgi:hypothetical protein